MNEEMKACVNENARMMNEEMQVKMNEKMKTMHMVCNGPWLLCMSWLFVHVFMEKLSN